ncbi:uncharacterized protein BDR25DRAFT_367236 [Lindgomyces ingoldianus]|uniref:Uncharacterized protein n=1 Tax=Lindgomyces ingoldianus TaxID=673940 RepID=A0ACB6QWX2_9PLEO|nr:uncharacterized protein BDR25DRAFT_367236 [Lindgomyces ingoldianus]KAF2471544.1 hypothetical protein BDR25DRAFT_367236 [Lindgomyces ingoldianus]
MSLHGGQYELGMEDMLMTKTYAFANRFDVPKLKSVVCMEITGFGDVHYAPCLEVGEYAFTNLDSNDPTLDFFTDTNIIFWEPRFQAEEDKNLEDGMYEKMPRLFLVRSMTKYAEWLHLRKGLTMGELDICSHHQHASREEQEECWKLQEDLKAVQKAEAEISMIQKAMAEEAAVEKTNAEKPKTGDPGRESRGLARKRPRSESLA